MPVCQRFSEKMQYDSIHKNLQNQVLAGQPGDVLHPIRVLSEEVSLMSDYELIMIILTIGLVVIHVIDLQNKK